MTNDECSVRVLTIFLSKMCKSVSDTKVVGLRSNGLRTPPLQVRVGMIVLIELMRKLSNVGYICTLLRVLNVSKCAFILSAIKGPCKIYRFNGSFTYFFSKSILITNLNKKVLKVIYMYLITFFNLNSLTDSV